MNSSWIKSKSFLIPSGLWLVFVIVHLIGFQTGYHKYDSVARTMIQWDGQLYLSIARDGYERFPCPDNSNNICGTGGWFPMYPVIGAVAALLIPDHRYALIVVSWLMLWLGLLMLYRLAARVFNERVAIFALVALLLFPGSFYLLTGFPYATLLVFSLLVLSLLEAGRLRWLWLPTALATLTYPSGAVIGLPLLVYLVMHWKQLSQRDRAYVIAALVSIPTAIFVYFGYYWYRFDDFWLYVRIQSQSYYAHEPSFPLLVIYRGLTELPFGSPVVASLLAAIIATAAFYSRRLPGVWQWLMFAILLFTPTMGTTDCYYRHIVVVWPLAVMIALAGDSPRRWWLLPLWAAAAIYVNWWLLLPAYKAGALM